MATLRQLITELQQTARENGHGDGDDLQVGIDKHGAIRLFPAADDKPGWESIRMATAEDA